ncbi:MAG: tRNA (adenosine(37)-N6)-threonylcarbamoyltransferase complex transferase subunit TsaD, partial [Bdellovibrionaceae bacterium]|nr:tRNA (adenosine(37)-N6)-threonylcarbamoyltransferase complex transferase subunit TsaD [Pseudobdellovibrionaceae bacterium]
VVPEIAGRNHLDAMVPLIEELFHQTQLTWKDISGIAVTNRPGLIGSLIVGLVTAKTLALLHKKNFLGTHHIEGHIVSSFLGDDTHAPTPMWLEPFISLVVSGGHTHLYLVEKPGSYVLLGKTQDDAAGEAFDKFAKMMGLGYPGGVHVDRLAKTGNTKAYEFPRGMSKDKSFNFSFSGLKASAQRWRDQNLKTEIKNQDLAATVLTETQIADVCASYQEAIVDSLMDKLESAMQVHKIKRFTISGGVSANSRLRARAQELALKRKWDFIVPPLRYCTDNAAMIAYAGALRLARGEVSEYDLKPFARADLG